MYNYESIKASRKLSEYEHRQNFVNVLFLLHQNGQAWFLCLIAYQPSWVI